jgi:hypothetical protein
MKGKLNKFSFFNYNRQITTKIDIKQFEFRDKEDIGISNIGISNIGISDIGISDIGISDIGISDISISDKDDISGISDISSVSDINLSKEDNLKKNKKKQIPKHIKTLIWNRYIGDDIIKHKCLCCKYETIRNTDFEAGHVLSEHNGGTNEISNLRPICRPCNASMGTMHMIDYIKMYGLYI